MTQQTDTTKLVAMYRAAGYEVTEEAAQFVVTKTVRARPIRVVLTAHVDSITLDDDGPSINLETQSSYVSVRLSEIELYEEPRDA